jgi:hypothetical protein
VNGIGIFTFDGDELLGEKVVSDMLSLLRQISEPSTEGISI